MDHIKVETKRLVWVDWAKVILIYLMIVGHLFPIDSFCQLIYAFHMPAFFIISGYLYREHDWRRTLKSFAIPLICFSCINFIIWVIPKWIKGTLDLSNLIERILIPYWGGPAKELDYIILFPGCWFVFALLFGRFLMGDIKVFSFIRKFALYSIVVLCLILVVESLLFPNNIFIDYKWQRVIPSLPFLLLGYCMKKWKGIKRMNKVTFLFLFVNFVVLGIWQGDCNILDYKFGFSYVIFFITAICGSLCLFKICTKFRESKIIQTLSTGTLFMLAFNFSFIVAFRFIYTKLGLEVLIKDQVIMPWITGLIILIICYFPIKWLLNTYPVLLGK